VHFGIIIIYAVPGTPPDSTLADSAPLFINPTISNAAVLAILVAPCWAI